MAVSGILHSNCLSSGIEEQGLGHVVLQLCIIQGAQVAQGDGTTTYAEPQAEKEVRYMYTYIRIAYVYVYIYIYMYVYIHTHSSIVMVTRFTAHGRTDFVETPLRTIKKALEISM